MSDPIICAYALGAINYKNGFVTSCPQQSDQLHIYKDGNTVKPSEIINSRKFRLHRKEMMAGVWSKGCHLCKEAEAIGSKSMRKDYKVSEDDLKKYDSETGRIDLSSVFHIELRFSNSCNMACLHCSDVYSSGWISKLKHYQADEEDRKYKLIQLTRTFHKDHPDEDLSISISIEQMEEIVNDLNKNFPNLRKIDFAGGEVLYQKQFFPCLRLLANHPKAKTMLIAFHTNFNARFNPEELSEVLKPFGYVNIQMSLDAGKNIYPYFRTGDWEVLKSNVERFRKVDQKCELNIKCTTSVYQMMDIEDVFRSFMELDVNYINSSIVYTPKYINPALISMEFKNEVYKDIQNTYKLINDELKHRHKNIEVYSKRRSWNRDKHTFSDIESAIESLKYIEHYIFSHRVSPEEWESFLVYIKKTDAIWNRNFNDYMKKYKFIDGKIVRQENV